MKEEERFKITSPGCVGCIYIITNPSMPGFVKIGYSDNLDNRLKTFNDSETTPYEFRVYCYYEVEKRLADKVLHKIIDGLNPGLRAKEETSEGKIRKREFYKMPSEDAFKILEDISIISGTEDRLHKIEPKKYEIEDEEAAEEYIEKVCSRASRFNFSTFGIPSGSELVFTKDSTKTVIVVDDHRVKYDEEITSLSSLAQRWMGKKHLPQGQRYFTYKGEVLTDIRKRIEAGKL